jgi:hypothetical protein
VPQNRWEDEDDVGHASRSSCLLHVEASWTRVFQSGLKTDGGATAGGACGTIAKVASESKLKMNGSIRRAASDPDTLILSFSLY